MLEYVLAVVVLAGMSLSLSVFYQGFVQGNMYGHAKDEDVNRIFLLSKEYAQLGLYRTVSLPTP